MNLDQRIFIVKSYQGKKYDEIWENYERTFGTPCPTPKAISSLMRKFDVTGSVLNAKKAGRPKNTRISVDEIKEIVLSSPRVSLRAHERQLPMPRSTLQRKIKKDLKLKSYHIQVVHHLHEEDFQKRMEMCSELLRLWTLQDLKNNIFSVTKRFFISVAPLIGTIAGSGRLKDHPTLLSIKLTLQR